MLSSIKVKPGWRNGLRVRLKIVWVIPCGFESHPGHRVPKPKLPEVDFKWTPKLAYVVGLLATDGNLSPDGRHISIKSAEISMLKTFKECLNLKNKIGRDKNGCYNVQFGNVQFYKWLLKIGLFPAKSYTIGVISVPDKLFRDFLRGCIDGDGNVRVYKDLYNVYRGRRYVAQRLFIRICSASRKFLLWLQAKTNKLAGIHGPVVISSKASEHNVTLYSLQFAKNESLKLIKWIYYKRNLPCLKRKRLVAERTAKVISKIKRRKYSFI